jgi:precorrin-8X/cobalt-precorrin-8 methylmutase
VSVSAPIRDPAEIYRRSFAIIRSEADLARFDAGAQEVVVRMIHACGMVDLADDIVISPGFAEAARAALAAGAPVICDVEMVRHGVIGRLMPSGNDVLCLLNDPQVREIASRDATTRSAAQVDLWATRMEGAVIAIGNAPTALFRLLELIDAGAPKPAAIIGVPVGFVGAVESKDALVADSRGVEFLTVTGRRGGSALASSAVNATAGGLEGHG